MMERTKFRDFVARKGLKMTREREAILAEVLISPGHFAPDDLFVRLRARGSKISRASIYRAIPLFVECGIVTEVEHRDKHSHYELMTKNAHHDHMICLQCGRVIEFYSKNLESLQDRLCRQEQFTGMRHNLEILGICRSCRS